MLGKFIAAYIGEKMFSGRNRGSTGGVRGRATASGSARGARPLVMMLAAGYGFKMLNDYRTKRRPSV